MTSKSMRAADALRAMAQFRLATLSDVIGEGGIVVVAPHQDDESLACGGLIAESCAAGRAVKVIFVSDGTGSHPRSRAYPRLRLRALREAEARRAARALGLAPRDLEFLRLPDRFVLTDGAIARAAVQRIVATATAIDASALFVSWRHDPHCDHQASYRLAREAQKKLGAALYEYSVWGVALSPSEAVTPPRSGFRLSLGQHHVRKQCAIRAHRSQTSNLISDDPDGFHFSQNDLERFATPYESFIASGE